MEGTVTISLKDYEELKAKAEDRDHYFKLVAKHVGLFEEIEEFLKVEEIDTDLTEKISKILNKWYG